jgi:hypothetical protein
MNESVSLEAAPGRSPEAAALGEFSTPPPLSRGGGRTNVPPAAPVPSELFAGQCVAGGLLGFLGFGLTVLAASKEACGIVNDPDSGYAEGTLTRWPSTVSELNSDWQSARGRLFFGFMLVTAGLLYLSRMPDHLDRLPFERHPGRLNERGSSDRVFCLADCGPGCETFPCVSCFSWWRRRRDSGSATPLLADQRQRNAAPRRSSPVCCVGPVGDVIEHYLQQFRLIVAPLGIVFVALCPTNNYWTQRKPGSDLVKDVHLSAAFLLFVGGTVTELMRIYFLWCESRADRLRQDRPTEEDDQRYTSCRRFVSDPNRSTEETDIPEARQSAIVRALAPVPEGIGPLRPWLMLCCSVGLIGSIWSCSKEITMHEDEMQVVRGDVVLSPIGTAFCPAPQFQYAQVHSTRAMNQTLARLMLPWVRDSELEPWVRPQPRPNAAGCAPRPAADCAPFADGHLLKPSEPGFEKQCKKMNPDCVFEAAVAGGRRARCSHSADSGAIPSGNATEACFLFEASRVKEDEIEKLQGRCKMETASPDEYLTDSTNLWNVTTYNEAERRCSPHCRQADSVHRDRCAMINENGKGQLINFNCANQVIVPEFMAICICSPTDDQIDTCNWNDPKPAPFRVQVFIQESFLAVILLLNYLAIAIEYLMRNGGERLLPCAECTLTLGRASIPLAMFVLSFVIRAYYWDIAKSGNAQGETGSKIDRTIIESYFVKGDLPEPSKWFEWQLRLYWISSAGLLWFYGMRLYHRGNNFALGMYCTMVLLTLVAVGIWLCGTIGQAQLNPGDSARTFTLWLTEDFTFIGAVGLVAWGSCHSADQRFGLKLVGCCCVTGVLTPLILILCVYFLPDYDFKDTEGGVPGLSPGSRSWTDTVVQLLGNFGMQVLVLGLLVQGTLKAKTMQCCANGAELEPQTPLSTQTPVDTHLTNEQL